MSQSHVLGRALTVAAALAAVVAVAFVLLGSGGGDYTVHARFQNAGQLVKGDLVQVAGNRVGEVRDIELTDSGQADLTLTINDDTYAPLRRGTLATVRQASLSGVANRYVDLRMPAGGSKTTIDDGGTIQSADTTSAVDLDQLFNTFDPKSRQALKGVIQGFARSYQGRSDAGERRLAVPQPVARRDLPPLSRDQPRHAVAAALHRCELAPGDRRGRPSRRPRGPRRRPRDDDRRHRPPEAGAGIIDRPAAGLHAQRELDVRQPARRARRPRPARAREQAGGQAATTVPGGAAPVRP